MPLIEIGEMHISVQEFLDSMSEKEKLEMLRGLQRHQDKAYRYNKNFRESLEAIMRNEISVTREEEEIIYNISKRFI